MSSQQPKDKLNQLMSYAPDYYWNSALWKQMMTAQANEALELQDVLDDIQNQFFVTTATWGLSFWEKEFGLPVNTSDTDQNRRNKVLSRLKANTTATPQVMTDIVQSFGVTARVGMDYTVGKITITILSPYGVPANDTQMKAQIDALRPAHLSWAFVYTYASWQSFKNRPWTWNQVMTNGTWQTLQVTQ